MQPVARATLSVAQRMRASAASAAAWASTSALPVTPLPQTATTTAPTPAATTPTTADHHHHHHHHPATALPPSLFDALASLFPPTRRGAARVIDLTPTAPLAVPLAARGLRASAAASPPTGSRIADADLVVSWRPAGDDGSDAEQHEQQHLLLREARRLLRQDGGGFFAVAALECDAPSSPFAAALLALLRAHGASAEAAACAADAVAAAGNPLPPAPAAAGTHPHHPHHQQHHPHHHPLLPLDKDDATAAGAHDLLPCSVSSHPVAVELRGGSSALASALLAHPAIAKAIGSSPDRQRAFAADVRELAQEHALACASAVGNGGNGGNGNGGNGSSTALRVDLRARLVVLRRAAEAAMERRRRYDDF